METTIKVEGIVLKPCAYEECIEGIPLGTPPEINKCPRHYALQRMKELR